MPQQPKYGEEQSLDDQVQLDPVPAQTGGSGAGATPAPGAGGGTGGGWQGGEVSRPFSVQDYLHLPEWFSEIGGIGDRLSGGFHNWVDYQRAVNEGRAPTYGEQIESAAERRFPILANPYVQAAGRYGIPALQIAGALFAGPAGRMYEDPIAAENFSRQYTRPGG